MHTFFNKHHEGSLLPSTKPDHHLWGKIETIKVIKAFFTFSLVSEDSLRDNTTHVKGGYLLEW